MLWLPHQCYYYSNSVFGINIQDTSCLSRTELQVKGELFIGSNHLHLMSCAESSMWFCQMVSSFSLSDSLSLSLSFFLSSTPLSMPYKLQGIWKGEHNSLASHKGMRMERLIERRRERERERESWVESIEQNQYHDLHGQQHRRSKVFVAPFLYQNVCLSVCLCHRGCFISV